MNSLPDKWEREDLEQYGALGLLDAIERYQEDLGSSFKSYAKKRIYGTIIDNVRRNTWLSRKTISKIQAVNRAKKEIEQGSGHEATLEQIIQSTGYTADQIFKIEQYKTRSQFASLDAPVFGDIDQTMTLKDMIAGYHSVEDEVVKNEMIRSLANIIDDLAEREKLIITLYYYEELTMKEIGEVLEISEGRVSQLHKRVLREMKKKMI